MTRASIRTPAVDAVREAGIEHSVTRHGRVRSLEEAAAARGIEPRDLIKTLVVRRSEDEHVFVLVPGDRTFSWAKVRALLGTNRISMPDAETAKAVTGYERGTITPFGSATPLPVIADSHLVGVASRSVGALTASVSPCEATTSSGSSTRRSPTSPTRRPTSA